MFDVFNRFCIITIEGGFGKFMKHLINMPSYKKQEKSSVEKGKSEISSDDAMSQVAEIIIQDVLEKDTSRIESFELYAHQLKTHFFSNPDSFKFRLCKGYRVLLEELEKEPIT